MSNKKIWLSSPHMGLQEIEYVKEAFETNWISPVGPHIEKFESSLAQYVGIPNVTALASGTAAIHLALIILGIEKGDEVLCSSFTFAGTCNPVVYLGATPVFIDSERDTWNMDPNLLEDAVKARLKAGKKPKAIIPVHLYGMPAKIDAIMEVAARYGIPVVEDAAEGLGSTYQGKKLGSFGDISILSFNGNKIITTSGGGAILSTNKAWIQKAKFLSTQARDPAPHYEHSQIGYNYRLSNVSAAIGIGQMQVLNERVNQRRDIFEQYRKHLSQYGHITFQLEQIGSYSNRWLTCVTVSKDAKVTSETLRLGLEKENIESRPLWKPMHLQPVFKDAPYYGRGVSDGLFDCGLCLPSGSNMTSEDMDRILSTLHALLQQ